MDKMRLATRMSDILGRHCFWYEPQELIDWFSGQPNEYVELTAKAYGDSYETSIEEVLDERELAELRDLAEQLDINLPDSVWYD